MSCVPPNGTDTNWFCYTARTYQETNSGKSCIQINKTKLHFTNLLVFFTQNIATKFVRGCCEVTENAPYCREGDGNDDQEFQVNGIKYRVIRCEGDFCNNDTATIEGSRNDELCNDESGCIETSPITTTITTTTATSGSSPSSWLKSTKLQYFNFLSGIVLQLLFLLAAFETVSP